MVLCAWVCAIVVRAAVPSEVLRLGDSVRTGTGRAGPQGRGLPLHVSEISPIRFAVSGSARARLTKRERTGLQNPQTAAPRESRGVTRADFVHHSSYRIQRLITHARPAYFAYRAHISPHSVGCAKVVGVQQPPTRLGNTPNKYNAVQLECSVLQSRPPICLDPPTLTQPPA